MAQVSFYQNWKILNPRFNSILGSSKSYLEDQHTPFQKMKLNAFLIKHKKKNTFIWKKSSRMSLLGFKSSPKSNKKINEAR